MSRERALANFSCPERSFHVTSTIASADFRSSRRMPLFSSIKRAIALSARSGQAIDLHGTFSCEQGIRFISFYDILSRDLSVEEYQALAEFRYQIRRFLHFSEEQARAHGL